MISIYLFTAFFNPILIGDCKRSGSENGSLFFCLRSKLESERESFI